MVVGTSCRPRPNTEGGQILLSVPCSSTQPSRRAVHARKKAKAATTDVKTCPDSPTLNCQEPRSGVGSWRPPFHLPAIQGQPRDPFVSLAAVVPIRGSLIPFPWRRLMQEQIHKERRPSIVISQHCAKRNIVAAVSSDLRQPALHASTVRCRIGSHARRDCPIWHCFRNAFVKGLQ